MTCAPCQRRRKLIGSTLVKVTSWPYRTWRNRTNLIESIYQAWCQFFAMGYKVDYDVGAPLKWQAMLKEGERISAKIDRLETEITSDDENPMDQWDDIGWPVAGGKVPNCS